MIRKKKLVVFFFIIAIVLLLSVSIAYAALSSTITVTVNKVTQQAMTWDIGFQTGTITGELTSTNSIADCGSATATATTISGISTRLADVGDKCAYTFHILNKGTIGGKVSNIAIVKPADTTCTINGSTMVCGDITYKLRYNNATSTSLLALNDTIAPKSGSTPTDQTVVLTIEHTGTTASTTDYNQSGFSYTITYGQN